jgi:hypothetical protein
MCIASAILVTGSVICFYFIFCSYYVFVYLTCVRCLYIFLEHRQQTLANFDGAVVVVLVWWLDLQLSVQSVPITTKNVSSNTAQCEE